MDGLENHPLAPLLNKRNKFQAVYVNFERANRSGRISINPTFEDVVVAETGQLVMSSVTLPYNSSIAACDLVTGDIVSFEAHLRGHVTSSFSLLDDEGRILDDAAGPRTVLRLYQPTNFEKIGHIELDKS